MFFVLRKRVRDARLAVFFIWRRLSFKYRLTIDFDQYDEDDDEGGRYT